MNESIDSLRAAERALYAAMISQDFPALEAILVPDLVYVHSTAVAESKAEYLAGVADGLYEYERIESRDVAIKMYDGVAVMTGRVGMSVGERGRPKGWIELLFVLVWVADSGRWRLAYRLATRQPG
jgi:hypothetical protein